MAFYVRVKIKFRAFGMTFAEWDRRYRVTYFNNKWDAEQVEIDVPSLAKVLVDRNGVKVNLWA